MTRLAGFLRTYWTRGTPGRPTPQSATVLMLRWWLVAFAFKLLGSSWDVSWHFKWLRDEVLPDVAVNEDRALQHQRLDAGPRPVRISL